MKKKSVKFKVFLMMLVSILFISAIFLILLQRQKYDENKQDNNSIVNGYILELNEISHECMAGSDDTVERIDSLADRIRDDREAVKEKRSNTLAISYVFVVFADVAIFIYTH